MTNGGRKPFVEFDHSGDVGIEAWGPDLATLIEHATRGLFGLLCRGDVGTSKKRAIRVAAGSDEDLVVDWLNDVIALAGAHGEVYGSVTVERAGDGHAEGFVGGEPIDASRHEPRFDVKAATYHGLSLTRKKDGLNVRVVFDL